MNHEKRKLPRFHVTPCQFLDQSCGKIFPVQDISKGGVALWMIDREDLPRFAVSSLHEGQVKVEGRKVPCRFKVRYIRGTLVGAEWVDMSPELHEHLDELSHPERLASNLKRYELPDLNQTQWFHNPVGVDLLFYASEGSRVGRWMLYIHQSFVQWENDSGVQTGQAVAEADDVQGSGIVRLETRLIEYDAMVDRSLVRAARELIEKTSLGNEDLKTAILNHLSGVI